MSSLLSECFSVLTEKRKLKIASQQILAKLASPFKMSTSGSKPTSDILEIEVPESLILRSLPAELHIHILSFLSLGDQINVIQTCSLWRHLLLTSASLKRTRYLLPHQARHSIPYIHRIIDPAGWFRIHLDFETRKVKKLRYCPIPDSARKWETEEGWVTDIPENMRYHDNWITLPSTCAFLDEPLIYPGPALSPPPRPETDTGMEVVIGKNGNERKLEYGHKYKKRTHIISEDLITLRMTSLPRGASYRAWDFTKEDVRVRDLMDWFSTCAILDGGKIYDRGEYELKFTHNYGNEKIYVYIFETGTEW
ncbi:hypothetical protein TWF694_011546 [Orbilia ellipsospora]|uniref:F-box domain-containing protein n=1 Tax=Orbilia ellipsospora TaxID=2528407 RepID=A0AAV9X5K1_9PEZI